MNPQHIKTGSEGEDLASDYLISLGHKIISRNFRTKFGEIDIISVDKFGITVFTEVKTIRRSHLQNPSVLYTEKSFPHAIHYAGDNSSADGPFRPEDNYTTGKAGRFRRVAQFYANKYPDSIGRKGYRLDLITLTISDSSVVIRRYRNV